MIHRSHRRSTCLVLAGALALTTSGCFGPYYTPENLDLPVAVAPEVGPVEKVVVTKFTIGSWTQTMSTSGGFGYTTTTTTTTTSYRDGSSEIAEQLRNAGVPAVARSAVSAGDLEPGEILLQASIDAYDSYLYGGPGEVLNIIFLSATLLVYGGILPFFYPPRGGVKFTVNLEAIDSAGNIFWTHTEEVRGYFRNLWFWTWYPPSGSSDHQKQVSQEISKYLGPAIAKALKPAMQGAAQ